MALPLLPVLKLIALGSIKIVLLGIGALVIPVFTVRMVVGGTGESIRLATTWMVDHNQMSSEDAEHFLDSLTKVQQADFSREQARGLLFAMISKTATGTLNSIKTMGRWVVGLFSRNT